MKVLQLQRKVEQCQCCIKKCARQILIRTRERDAVHCRANGILDANGFYGIGLHLVDTNTNVDTSSVTVDVPGLTIFQAFEFVAKRFGWTVEYNGGCVFVRGNRAGR